MNKLRCFLIAAIVVISSSTLALGGDIQGPGKSDSPSPPASTTESTANSVTAPTSTEEIQIVLHDASKMLLEILLTIY